MMKIINQHGSGLMPPEANRSLEDLYIQYRIYYNRRLDISQVEFPGTPSMHKTLSTPKDLQTGLWNIAVYYSLYAPKFTASNICCLAYVYDHVRAHLWFSITFFVLGHEENCLAQDP